MEITQDVIAIVVSAIVLGVLYFSGKYIVNYAQPLFVQYFETRYIIKDFKRRTKGVK